LAVENFFHQIFIGKILHENPGSLCVLKTCASSEDLRPESKEIPLAAGTHLVAHNNKFRLHTEIPPADTYAQSMGNGISGEVLPPYVYHCKLKLSLVNIRRGVSKWL